MCWYRSLNEAQKKTVEAQNFLKVEENLETHSSTRWILIVISKFLFYYQKNILYSIVKMN